MHAILALENGTVFKGRSFGAEGECAGEAVFNTSMTGYQEVITDPSYRGQIVAMTYPLIGNYGVNPFDCESRRPFLGGFVVKEYSKVVSNWRSTMSLGEYLKKEAIVAVEGIDTRALTLLLREKGAMRAVLSTREVSGESLIAKAVKSPGLVGVDLVRDVSIDAPYTWAGDSEGAAALAPARSSSHRYRIAVVDCGVKYNILRLLDRYGCSALVVPASMSAAEILAQKPDGILLSNGPGDPEAVPYVVDTVQSLMVKLPVFGICLGHQMLGLALGGKTFKLKFGHHGGNHPVKDLMTGKVAITVQNHGFCVDIDSLPRREVEITHVNLNDSTLEGMRHKKLPLFSVQFHPEAAPGPHDAEYLFARFIESVKKAKRG
jgi:carbamoyl-phosphate synthase small subunit